VQLLSDDLSICDQNPPTLLADRQTDARTDKRHSHGNTTLNTYVFRAV